jgi:hypothetical protein
MTRIIRLVAVCAVSALAFGALGAAAAQAVPGKITASEYPAFITGEHDSTLTITFGSTGIRTVTCTTTRISKTISEASAVTAFVPSFGGCTNSPGGGPVSILANGCTFDASIPSSASSELLTTISSCPSTAPVEIIANSTGGSVICEYSIASQGPLGGNTWENKAVGIKDITLRIESKMTATVKKGTLVACGASAGNAVSVKWVEPVTVKGFKDVGGVEGEQIPIEID